MRDTLATRIVRLVLCAVAAALVLVAMDEPIWTMKLEAPQYPKGLELRAFGQRLEGDIREINIINQYIGMKELSETPAPEMKLFPVGIAVLLVLIAAAPFHRHAYTGAVAALFLFPLTILGDMQLWLYRYGHSLDPDAPLRQKPFTPLVLGESEIGQFKSHAHLATGLELILAAAILLLLGYVFLLRRKKENSRRVPERLARAATLLAVLLVAQNGAAATLQSRIDAANAGGTINVSPGVYQERLVIRKPLTIVGVPGAIVDGGGIGSVITISGREVELRGLTVRNSGRKTTEEAAGIDVSGNDHRIIGNTIVDVHFGIHLTEGERNLVAGNVIRPGRSRGYRAGDGINLWSVKRSLVSGNRVSAARDGVYLSFTGDMTVRGNILAGSRYGVHSMFSENATVEKNTLRDNLLGAALMNSNRLVFRSNRVERNRTGATAYGILLKDIGDLVVEDNEIIQNRIGIYAGNAPDRRDRQAIVRGNLLFANETAFALQSNVRLVVTDNDIIDNLTEIRSEGGSLSASSWSLEGRGNYWSNYRGFDADGNGVGESAFTVSGALDYLLQRNQLIRIFLYTPAHSALELAARMFPLFRAEPLLRDEHPLMRPRRFQQEKPA